MCWNHLYLWEPPHPRCWAACDHLLSHPTSAHTDTLPHGHTDTQTHRITETQTYRHTDTQALRHTDTQTQIKTQTQTQAFVTWARPEQIIKCNTFIWNIDSSQSAKIHWIQLRCWCASNEMYSIRSVAMMSSAAVSFVLLTKYTLHSVSSFAPNVQHL